MTSRNYSVPAIIVGGGLNALGIVRSLGNEGVPLIVLCNDLKLPAMRSRFGRKVFIPQLEGSSLIDNLLELTKEFSTPAILFVTEEKTVITVSEYRERLSTFFLIRLPQHERLMQLMHKQGFYELAEINNSPVPKTISLRSTDDLALVSKLKLPCILKPGKKDYAYGARFKKAYKVNSVSDITERYKEIQPVLSDMVVQEWIEGADSEIYFCLQYIGKDGAIVSSFVGRKIRSWPPNIGGTASCTIADEGAQVLHETTRLFFQQVGFTGMGSMEYKRDNRDGLFYMVEPTVSRTDFQEEVATINGVNIPLAAYRYELGLPQLARHDLVSPSIWRDPLSDKWSLEEGNGAPDKRSRSHIVFDAYWRWNDPLPWLDFMINRLVSRLASKR